MTMAVFTWTSVPGYEPYPCFDHIRDMMLTCTHRNLIIHIPVYIINTSIPVSGYLFAQVIVTSIVCNIKPKQFRNLRLLAGFALLNTNITFLLLKDKTQCLRHSSQVCFCGTSFGHVCAGSR